tara:strand:- start:392 stop:1012 length:621 start_codon:yes stop_codon:yes gene_type:complete
LASIFEFTIWLNFRLCGIFIVGLPLTLLFWSINKKNKAIEKLLSNYWKISILFFISLMLFIGKQEFSLLVLNLSMVLMTITAWFWSDINAELREYKISHPLTTTTKVWRWALTFITFNLIFQSILSKYCLLSINNGNCEYWIIPSNNLYNILKISFNFLFGANFTEPIAKFIGLFSLFIFILGLLQWFIIQFPRSGRKSDFSNHAK